MGEVKQVDGQCHCGAIAFEARVDAEKIVICHCVDCQIFSSAPYRVTAFTVDGGFRVTKGEPRVYVKTAESGRKREQGFCGDCGSSLFATNAGDGPKRYGLRTGVVNQREELRPTLQIWHRSALDWIDDVASLPSIPGQP